MWFGIREIGDLVARRWQPLAEAGGALAASWLFGFRLQVRAANRRRERRIEEELIAYAGLDVKLSGEGDCIELARRVSRLIAEKSAFRRAAMFVWSAEGRLALAASAGMDESTEHSLQAWGERIAAGQNRWCQARE
jgi:hypothetical protein